LRLVANGKTVATNAPLPAATPPATAPARTATESEPVVPPADKPAATERVAALP
jgi:hypothetical protein